MFDYFSSDLPNSIMTSFETWPTECGGERNRINFLEHILLTIDLTFMPRGYLEIDLVSPQNTTSTVLRRRPFDTGASSIANYSALSLHHWRENPKGNWTVKLRNTGRGQGKKFL